MLYNFNTAQESIEELKELEQVNDLKINEFFKDYEMFE